MNIQDMKIILASELDPEAFAAVKSLQDFPRHIGAQTHRQHLATERASGFVSAIVDAARNEKHAASGEKVMPEDVLQ